MQLRFLARLTTSLVAPMVVLGLAGCGADEVTTYTPVSDPAQLFWRVGINYSAITMAAAAPYDTLQLVATPYNAHGDTLQGLPAPTFGLANPADSVNLRVSSDGFVTALQPAVGIKIIAEIAVPGNIRRADTALVNITSAPPAPLGTLTMDVMAPDSAIWAIAPVDAYKENQPALGDTLQQYPAFTYFLVSNPTYLSTFLTIYDLPPLVRAFDAAGNPMDATQLAIEYRSLDPDIVSIPVSTGPNYRWTGSTRPYRTGKARLEARATAYGVTRADTLTVTVTPPSFVSLPIRPIPGTTALYGFGDRDRTIRTYGVVMWMNTLDRPVDVVFDDPANVVPAPTAYCDTGVLLLNFFFGVPADASACHTTGGNVTIPEPAAATSAEIYKTAQLQQFTQAGTYTYHDAQSGASGRIIVVDVGN